MKIKTVPLTLSLACGGVGTIFFLLHSEDLIGTHLAFFALTAVLVFYLAGQVAHLREAHPDRWMLNPVFLCTCITFVLGFGIGNLLFFLPPDTLDLLGFVPEISSSMLKLMALVLLAAIGMWQGYWSGAATKLSGRARQERFSALLRKSNHLRGLAIPLLLLVSVSSRLFQIHLGIFGYSSTYDALIRAGTYTQYLALLSSLGKLALVAAALHYYMSKRASKPQLLVVLAVEVTFGVLSGFKSQIAMPFVTMGVAQYLVTGRIPKAWLVAVAAGIVVSYQIVEPFRAYRNNQMDYRGGSATEILAGIIGAQTVDLKSATDETQEVAVLISFLARSSFTYIGSMGIDYKDSVPEMPAGSPAFLKAILMTPAYAWIPRAIWTNKPVGNLGLWYSQEVLGKPNSRSSTAMTPVTYLYFTGGAVAVFIGFFVMGVIQRVAFSWTQPTRYLGGAVLFLGLLQAMAAPPDSFSDFLMTFIREAPLLLLVQSFLVAPLPRRLSQWKMRAGVPPLTRKS